MKQLPSGSIVIEVAAAKQEFHCFNVYPLKSEQPQLHNIKVLPRSNLGNKNLWICVVSHKKFPKQNGVVLLLPLVHSQ